MCVYIYISVHLCELFLFSSVMGKIWTPRLAITQVEYISIINGFGFFFGLFQKQELIRGNYEYQLDISSDKH